MLSRPGVTNHAARTQNEIVWSPHGKEEVRAEEVLRAVSLVIDGLSLLRGGAPRASPETVRRWRRGRLEPGEGEPTPAIAGDGKEAPMDGRPRLGDSLTTLGAQAHHLRHAVRRSTSPGRRWTSWRAGRRPGTPGEDGPGRRLREGLRVRRDHGFRHRFVSHVRFSTGSGRGWRRGPGRRHQAPEACAVRAFWARRDLRPCATAPQGVETSRAVTRGQDARLLRRTGLW